MRRAALLLAATLLGGLAAAPVASALTHWNEPFASLYGWTVTGQGASIDATGSYGTGLKIAPPSSQAGPTVVERDIDISAGFTLTEVSLMFKTPSRSMPNWGSQEATLSIVRDGGAVAYLRLHNTGLDWWHVEVSNGYWSASATSTMLPRDTWLRMVLAIKPDSGTYEGKVVSISTIHGYTVELPDYHTGNIRHVAISGQGSLRPFHFDELWMQVVCGRPSSEVRDLVAAPSGAGRITVSWRDINPYHDCPLKRYEVERSESSLGPWQPIGQTKNRYYTDASLPPSATYTYRVTPVNEAGHGHALRSNPATTFGLPGAPAVTAREGPNDDEVTVEWTAPANTGGMPVRSFRLYSATSASGPFTDRGAKSSPFVERELGPSVTMHYQVTAVTEVGEGEPGSASASSRAYTVPSPPLNLVAASQPGEIRLVWQPPSYDGPGIFGYQVYRGFEDGPRALLGETGPEPTYADTGCPLGRVCTYEVRATNRAGTGDPSEPAQALGTALPPDSPVLDPAYATATDPDQDGHGSVDEALGNANPLLGDSHPDEDSNCDGTPDRDEGTYLSAQGHGHKWLRVQPGQGVVADPDALEDGGSLASADPGSVAFYTEEDETC